MVLSRERALRALLSVIAALAAASARADGISARYEPEYAAAETRTTTAEGTTELVSQTFGQAYRLSLDRGFTRSLRLSAGGVFDWDQGTVYQNRVRTDREDRQTNLYGTLSFGDALVGGSAGYARREGIALDLQGRTRAVTEAYTTSLRWRPDGFPSVDLQAGRQLTHEGGVHRGTSDHATLSSRYEATPSLDLRYSLRLAHPVDHVAGSESVNVGNAAQATYSRRLLEGRTTLSLTYDVSHTHLRMLSAGNGEVATQQLPVAGLSLVEEFPALPEQSTLVPNPALVDGRTGTSANLNLGTRPSATGDTRNRHAGVQFADVATPVNAAFLSVDRPVPLNVAATVIFTVWVSDDNLRWREVRPEARPVPGGLGVREAVRYDPIESRFEIRFPQLAARYLKVVVRPLSLAATTDPALSDLFVTELQTVLEQPAASVAQTSSSFANRVSGAARTRLLSKRDLFHDVAAEVAYASGRGGRPTYSLENGLSFREQLNPVFTLAARVARVDYDQARGHEGAFLYSASVAAVPLPTLTHVLAYSGAWVQSVDGENLRNGVSLSNQIQLYDGISLAALGSYSLDVASPGRTTHNAMASTTATVVPHRTTSITGSYVRSWTRQLATGLPARSDESQRVEGNVSFTPFPALYLFAGGSQVRARGGPQTLANFGAALSPFSGGDLQLRFSYIETLDSASDGKTRMMSPSLRWNIRRGTYLDVTYSTLDAEAAAADVRSRSVTASLAVPIW